MQDELEYEEARRLLRPLAGEPTRPSAVDIRRAIAAGRRRIRIRRIAGIGTAAVVTALIVAGVPVARDLVAAPDQPPPVALAPPTTAVPTPPVASSPESPPPPSRCSLELLPEPAEAYQSLVTAADPTGRLIAGRVYTETPASVQIDVVIWEDGELVEVAMPGADPTLDDLSSRGVGVGTSYPDLSVESETGWLYLDGEVTRLPGPVSALDGLSINEAGVIAGSQPAADGEGRQRVVPLVWPTADSGPEQLSVPGRSWSVAARDIDADGTVVGTGYDLAAGPDAPDHSFVWLPDGTREELPLPTIDGAPVDGFRAGSIHDGVVTGQATQLVEDGWTYHTVRYDLRTGEFADLSSRTAVMAEAWNRHGWVAGPGGDGLALSAPPVGPVPLPDLGNRPTGDGFYVNLVETVSDDGRIVAGQVDDDDGNAHAARWRCR